MDLRLEVITVPVSDIDVAKTFYVDTLGFIVDRDIQVSDEFRFIQLTAPGSQCSIHLSTDAAMMSPGSLKGVILVVDDAQKAKVLLESKGLQMSEIDELDFGKHIYFEDPDGNSWIVQESYSQNASKSQ